MNPLKQRFLALWDQAQERGWSQADLARRLDMSRAGVNGIVTGEENPSAPTVRLFETVLRADLPDVLRETPPPYGTDAAKLVAELESLDPKVRPEVIQGVRQIIKAYHKPRRKPPSGSHKPT